MMNPLDQLWWKDACSAGSAYSTCEIIREPGVKISRVSPTFGCLPGDTREGGACGGDAGRLIKHSSLIELRMWLQSVEFPETDRHRSAVIWKLKDAQQWMNDAWLMIDWSIIFIHHWLMMPFSLPDISLQDSEDILYASRMNILIKEWVWYTGTIAPRFTCRLVGSQ